MKRAGIFNPYWSTLGGGEKYCATVAETLINAGYSLDIFWNDSTLIQRLYERFNINITSANFVSLSDHLFNRLQQIHTYDLLFWVSDGSIPFMNAKKNLLHFQVPFQNVHGKSISNKLKLSRVHSIVCNSKFTKSIIDKEFGVTSEVVYPPSTMFTSGIKKNLILSVGRFDNVLHAKRQDVLIKAFKKLNNASWNLVLAGGSLPNNQEINKLQKQINNHPNIKLVINPSFESLSELYSKAIIYWHAAGYGAELDTHPEKAEHFGISTVEAMSAGAVPVVFKGGGQVEIVSNQVGRLWSTPDNLIEMTNQLIQNPDQLQNLSNKAIERANRFSAKEFTYEFTKIIG